MATSARSRIAALGVMLIGLVGSWVYAQFLDDIYPIRLWLFWRVAILWGWTALFSLACTCFGQFVLVRALRLRGLPALESAVFAMSTGVVAFAMAMYAAGAVGLFTRPFAIALPIVMVAIGARDAKPLALELWKDWHAPEPRSLGRIALSAAGVVCVGLIYLGAFSPDSLNYDAAWSHQVIAQEYARNGRIVPFPADYNRNVPHLASLIYTWGYLLPGLNTPLRYMMSLHNEVALFLWTLAAVSAAMRAMLGDPGLRRGWISFFLFPIIFVYDNNLGGAADHVCGFFSVPIALAALRSCERFDRGAAALFAIVCAGALLTKLQAVFVVGSAGLVVAGHWVWQLAAHARARRSAGVQPPAATLRDLIWAPFLVLGLAALLFAPHALRQIIYHHNPLYPFLQDVFTASTPSVPDGAFLVSHALADPLYQPQGTFWEKLLHAAELFVTFSFVPHYSFTRDQPAFGSLFTLLFPCLLFLRNRRLWTVAAIAAGAVLAWGFIYNVDRNLQVFMPVLVSVTGAIVVVAWRMGVLARIGVGALVAVQVIWGSDALFYSSHERIRDAMDLIRTGYEGTAHKRFRRYREEYLAIGRATPPDARILVHVMHVTLGIQRQTLLDGPGFQGLIDYRHITTPRQLYDYYARLGITHLLDDVHGDPAATSQEQVVFDALVAAYGTPTRFNGYRLTPMPEVPPPHAAPYVVASLGQWGYADGLYPITALRTLRFLPEDKRVYAEPREPMPEDRKRWHEVVAKADAVIVQRDTKLEAATRTLLKKQYTVIRRVPREFTVYLKNTHVPNRSAGAAD